MQDLQEINKITIVPLGGLASPELLLLEEESFLEES